MNTDTLLMACQNRATLQAKLRQPTEPLSTYWHHFKLLARQNPFWFSSYSVLAFVVTGEEVYRQQARDLFLRFTRNKDAGLLSIEPQIHTHTASAPLGRMMALYDWIADTDLLTPAEDSAFRGAALDFAAQIPMPQLQGRARMFDNQVFSNAFGAAVAGHVLGVRRGDSAQARRMYAVGMEWLLDQFGRLPAGCFSGEGSTYHMLVVMPLLTLAGAFVEEVTGAPLYQRGQAPAHAPLRDWLTMGRDMVGPEGLLPGWDAFGVYHNSVRAPLAYLARRDRDADALALIRDTRMWYPMAHVAWEFDDRLWTLVWWPEEVEAAPACPFYSWMRPASAGALQEASTGTRLFQYWDECGGGPQNGRYQVNPNAIELQSGGLPVLLDGAPSLPTELLNLDESALLNYLPASMIQGWRRLIGQPDTPAGLSKALRKAVCGSIGDSNSLIVDGESWYVPLAPVAGKGQALHDAGSLQVIESEAADYYRDRYDVTKVTRISALIGGQVVLCLDDWASKTPHRLAWQVFTWPGAVQSAAGVQSDIGGQLRLDLRPGQAGTWLLTPVQGFPVSPCNASTRLQFQLPEPVSSARLLMALGIQAQYDAGENLSQGWALEPEPGQGAAAVDLTTFYLTDDSPSGSTLTFRRRFSVPAGEAGKPLQLRIPSATLSLRVQVNGVAVPPAYQQSNIEIQGSTSSFAQVFDVGAAVSDGENEITLTLKSFHGESVQGPVTLHRPVSMHEVGLSAAGVNQWAVRLGPQSHQVLLANAGMVAWAGGRTDARHGLLSAGGELALAGVCVAEFPELKIRLKSNLPVDVSVSGDRVTFGQIPVNARIVIHLSGGKIVVSAMAVLQVSCSVPGAVLRFRLDESSECYLNGCAMGRRGGPGDRLVEWPVSVEAPAVTGPVCSAEAVYRLADRLPVDLEVKLTGCLQSGDWRIQLAAVDVAGGVDARGLVPELLRLLELEEAKPPYPALTRSWSESKMNSALNEGVDHSVDTTIDPVEGAKRYRLKQALIVALGRLGDARALPALERMLMRGTDYFPALAQVPVALARLGSVSSQAVLQANWDFGEVNVRAHVRLGLGYLKGEISRTEFETRVNPA